MLCNELADVIPSSTKTIAVDNLTCNEEKQKFFKKTQIFLKPLNIDIENLQ